MTRDWVVSQAVSELEEEPVQASRLGSGAAKPHVGGVEAPRIASSGHPVHLPQISISLWSSSPRQIRRSRCRYSPPPLRRLSCRCQIRRHRCSPPQDPASPRPDPASSSAPSWGEEASGVEPSAATAAQRCRQIHHHRYLTPLPDPPPPPLPATTKARAPLMGSSRRRGEGRSRLAAERGGEKPSRTGEGRGEAGELRRRGEGSRRRGGVGVGGGGEGDWRSGSVACEKGNGREKGESKKEIGWKRGGRG
jgi:hypothetical protein